MTPTDICNLGLDVLKEATITSLDETRPIAMWCKRNFPTTRDALLERADWNFAIERFQLSADGAAPAFGWSYQYTLPPECLRVIPLTHDGTYEGRPILHEIEGRKILTDAAAPLNVRLVVRSENYDAYPATFVEALSARLAMKMAHWITGKSNYVQVAQGLYKEAMDAAWLSDAIQGTVPRAADNEWVDAR